VLALSCGFITAAMAAGHLIGVVTTAIDRSPPQYTFRAYSLLLLGAVLVALGTLLAVASMRVVYGERPAWRQGAWAAIALLAVNIPLAPINGFGGFLSIIAMIALVALLAGRASILKGA
jgi:hypothetical protein